MAENLVQYKSGTLEYTQKFSVPVNSAEWYEWLANNDRFSYVGSNGNNFNASKRVSGRSKGYWNAYRRINKRLRNCYLGTDTSITLDILEEKAKFLNLPEDAYEAAKAVNRTTPAPDYRGSVQNHDVAELQAWKEHTEQQMAEMFEQMKSLQEELKRSHTEAERSRTEAEQLRIVAQQPQPQPQPQPNAVEILNKLKAKNPKSKIDLKDIELALELVNDNVT